MITDWNLWKTGLMATEASIQLKCRIGFGTDGVLSSNGSIMIVNPENTIHQNDNINK